MDMATSIPPLMCNTPPPMEDSFDDEEDVSIVESIEDDSLAPSTPSKHKSIDTDLPVPDDLPPVVQSFIPAINSNDSNKQTKNEIETQSNASPKLPNDLSIYRSESPPSLDLQDPNVTDGSFDDPNLDEIPEDVFYSNTELSMPSHNLNAVFDTPPELDPTFSTDYQRTEDEVSISSKELSENDLSLPKLEIYAKDTDDIPSDRAIETSEPVDINIKGRNLDSPPPDYSTDDIPKRLATQSNMQSLLERTGSDTNLKYSPDLSDSFDYFVEYSDVVDTDLISNKMNITSPSNVSVDVREPSNNHKETTHPEKDIPNVDESSWIKNLRADTDDTIKETIEIYTQNNSSSNMDDENVNAFPTSDIQCDVTFAADFSQFKVLESDSIETHVAPFVSTNVADDEDDDDFGDFNDVPVTTVFNAPSLVPPFNYEEEDDDFGDFSDFQNSTKSSIPIVRTYIRDVCANVDSLLAMMFPTESDNRIINESTDKSLNEYLLNDITLAVRNVDDSKALQHQWLSSIGKSALVKALGIDARNILYGGKWNSSMPRYAANLGFNPLEPMKPDVLYGQGLRSSEIPAAQFDWNSSGLVNPLDASHAPQHSLQLLDLDQLVVVSANLDNITLASLAAYLDGRRSSTNSVNSSSTVLPPVPMHRAPSTTPNIHCSPTSHPIIATSSKTNTSGFGSTSVVSPLNAIHLDPLHIGLSDDLRRGQFDHFLDSRVQEIIHEANSAQNRPPRPDTDWPVRQQHNTETSHLSGGTTAAPPAPFQLATQNTQEDTNYTDIPSPTSSSYVVPGSGTLKETHIFTPSKVVISTSPKPPIESTTTPRSDNVSEVPLGIRIDENVLKKEYRDIEYNLNLSPTIVSDEFSEFQSVGPLPPQVGDCLQPIQSGVVINWPDPGSVTSVEIGSFDDFSSTDPYHTSSKAEKSLHNNPISSSEIISGNIDDTNYLQRKSPSISDSPIDLVPVKPIVSNHLVKKDFDELLDFMPHSSLPIPSGSQVIKYPMIDKLNPPKSIDNGPSSVPIIKPSSNSNLFDDFSDFQSVPVANCLNADSFVPPMMQPIEPTPVLMPTRSTGISWPDPGIDADEMARLEAIFPTPKTISLPKPNPNTSHQVPGASEEVEWTDFVSSNAGFQPITHIINLNILKHQQEKPTVADDEDWSDFVSGGNQASNQFSPLKMATETGPSFPAWNAAPTQFGSLSKSTAPNKMPAGVFSTSIPSSLAPIDDSPNRTLNISLIPDLGFVAPPTSFNRGTSSTSSGRSAAYSFGSARK